MRLRFLSLAMTLILVTAPLPLIAQEEAPAPEPTGLMLPYTLAGEADAAGNQEAARQHLLDGLALFPASPHLRLGLAQANLALGDTAACLAALESLAAVGAALDLATYPPLSGIAELPEFALVALALKPTTAQPATVTATLNDHELWTEGIAWDETTCDLLAGSVKLGKLVRVRDGVCSDLGTSAQDDLLEIIGLDVDESRRTVWAVMGRDRTTPEAKHDFGEAPRDNGIVAYDLETGQQVVHHLRSADADDIIHMWNDVSVAPDGTAYFSDMTTATIWHLVPGGQPEIFLALKDVNYINGLAVSTDGSKLYVVSLEGMVVIDLPDGRQRMLKHPKNVYTGLGDGMAVGERHLFVVQNSGLLRQRILHLKLDPAGYEVESSEALECGLPEGLMAYTCALGDEVLYVNGTAPFARYDDQQPPPTPVIVELEFGLH